MVLTVVVMEARAVLFIYLFYFILFFSCGLGKRMDFQLNKLHLELKSVKQTRNVDNPAWIKA